MFALRPAGDAAAFRWQGGTTYLRDTLAVLATVEDGPGNAAGVLALEEQGLGLAVLETESLGVTADVELTLQVSQPG